MVGHGRAPGVEHGGDADPGAEMLRIGGDREQRSHRGQRELSAGDHVKARGQDDVVRRSLEADPEVALHTVGEVAGVVSVEHLHHDLHDLHDTLDIDSDDHHHGSPARPPVHAARVHRCYR